MYYGIYLINSGDSYEPDIVQCIVQGRTLEELANAIPSNVEDVLVTTDLPQACKMTRTIALPHQKDCPSC